MPLVRAFNLTPDELAKERHRLQKQGPRRMHTYGGHESNSGDDANTPSDGIAKSTRDVAVSNIPTRELSDTPLSDFHDAIAKVDSASAMPELTNGSGHRSSATGASQGILKWAPICRFVAFSWYC
jgi:hypothetical protein